MWVVFGNKFLLTTSLYIMAFTRQKNTAKLNGEGEYVSTVHSTCYWFNSTLHELLGQQYTPRATGSTLHSTTYWVNTTLN